MTTISLVTFLVLGAPALAVHTCPEKEVRDLAATLEPIREEHDLPALVAAVVTSDGLVAEGYVGVRERGSDNAVTSTDLFHLGSCTKAMTATLIARYVEEDELAWDTTVGMSFPDLAESMKPAWRDVTLAQLLSHTSGAPHDLRTYPALSVAVFANQKPVTQLRQFVVREITAVEPVFEPGTSWVYSNWGYVIAARILEVRTGRAWEDLIQERLFEPLGMRRCGFGAVCERPERKRRSDGDESEHNGQAEPRPNPCGHSEKGRPRPGLDNPATMAPAGTVHAPLADWARFVELHLRGARGDEDLLLTPDSFGYLHTAQPGSNGTYGAGWLITERPWTEGRVIAHDGTNTMWMAWTWIAPEEDFAVLIVTNQGGSAAQQGTDAAAWALIQEQLALQALEDEK